MSLEELKKKFIVDENVLRARLEPIIEKALKHCLIDKNGQVHITETSIAGRDQVMLVLTARAIAFQLESQIPAEVTVGDLSKYTGLPENQVRARGNDLIRSKFVDSPKPGLYRALPHKIETFLDSLATASNVKNERSSRLKKIGISLHKIKER